MADMRKPQGFGFNPFARQEGAGPDLIRARQGKDKPRPFFGPANFSMGVETGEIGKRVRNLFNTPAGASLDRVLRPPETGAEVTPSRTPAPLEGPGYASNRPGIKQAGVERTSDGPLTNRKGQPEVGQKAEEARRLIGTLNGKEIFSDDPRFAKKYDIVFDGSMGGATPADLWSLFPGRQAQQLQGQTTDKLLDAGIQPSSVGQAPTIQDQVRGVNQRLDRLRQPADFDPFSSAGRKYLMQRKNLMDERADLYDTMQTGMSVSGRESFGDKAALAKLQSDLRAGVNAADNAAAMERTTKTINAQNQRAKDAGAAELTLKKKERMAAAKQHFQQEAAKLLKEVNSNAIGTEEIGPRFAELMTLYKTIGGASGGASGMLDAKEYDTK